MTEAVGQYNEKFMLSSLGVTVLDKAILQEEAKKNLLRVPKLGDEMNDKDSDDVELLDLPGIRQISEMR